MSIGKITKAQASHCRVLIENFEIARVALQEASQEILEDWHGQFVNKSEKWQESEAGQEVQSSIEALDEFVNKLFDAEISENPFE